MEISVRTLRIIQLAGVIALLVLGAFILSSPEIVNFSNI